MRSRTLPALTANPPGKSVIQAVLESVTGRNLDPMQITYSNYSKPVGHGYNQSITVRTAVNLNTGEVLVTETEGAIV